MCEDLSSSSLFIAAKKSNSHNSAKCNCFKTLTRDHGAPVSLLL